MKKIQIAVISTILALVALFAILFINGNRKADPAGYVQANLDLIFQGELEGASEYLDATEEELDEIYDTGIQTFVDEYLMGEMDQDGSFSSTYEYLVKEVFRVMRYQVGDAVRTGGKTYEVTVTYQPTDIFTKFVPQIEEESQIIQKALNSGAYTGTKEEAAQSALLDYLYYAYEALEMAYLEADYGEKETFIFKVKVDGDTYKILNDGTNTFIEQILDLDNL